MLPTTFWILTISKITKTSFSFSGISATKHWIFTLMDQKKQCTKIMKFCIKDFFSKCDQIRCFLQIWLHLLKKSLTENFIFFAAQYTAEERMKIMEEYFESNAQIHTQQQFTSDFPGMKPLVLRTCDSVLKDHRENLPGRRLTVDWTCHQLFNCVKNKRESGKPLVSNVNLMLLWQICK